MNYNGIWGSFFRVSPKRQRELIFPNVETQGSGEAVGSL